MDTMTDTQQSEGAREDLYLLHYLNDRGEPVGMGTCFGFDERERAEQIATSWATRNGVPYVVRLGNKTVFRADP